MIMLLLKYNRIKYRMIKCIFLIEGLTINLLTVDVAGWAINPTSSHQDRSLLNRCKITRIISVNMGIRSINEANNQTFFEIRPNVWIPRTLLPTNVISKTDTGIISDKMAAVKYLISAFCGLKANWIPNIVKAMATKNDTIERTTWRGADSSSILLDFLNSLIMVWVSLSLLVLLLCSELSLVIKSGLICNAPCVDWMWILNKPVTKTKTTSVGMANIKNADIDTWLMNFILNVKLISNWLHGT